MIDITSLSKTYGEQTVLDIDQLHIPTGQTFGLVGNNGAGKTTLFSLMLDLHPDTPQQRFHPPIHQMERAFRQLPIAFQQVQLVPRALLFGSI